MQKKAEEGKMRRLNIYEQKLWWAEIGKEGQHNEQIKQNKREKKSKPLQTIKTENN